MVGRLEERFEKVRTRRDEVKYWQFVVLKKYNKTFSAVKIIENLYILNHKLSKLLYR